MEETSDSLSAHDRLDWEPSWTEARFVAFLKCDHCGDPMFVVGRRVWDEDYTQNADRWRPILVQNFEPLFLEPAPHVISTKSLPEPVATEMKKSFRLYWSDPAAAGNRVRCAVERMLDDHKVPKKFRRKKGKLTRAHLAERIERFEKMKPRFTHAVDKLNAIRWLGNAGSHGDLRQEDVLDAYEIIDAVFEVVYRPKTLDQKVRRILLNKGPAT